MTKLVCAECKAGKKRFCQTGIPVGICCQFQCQLAWYLFRLSSYLCTNLNIVDYCRIQACLSGLLRPNSGFYITFLCSLSTIIREWNAMHSIVDVKFKDLLLSPSSTPQVKNAAKLKVPVVCIIPNSFRNLPSYSTLMNSILTQFPWCSYQFMQDWWERQISLDYRHAMWP